MAVTSDMPDSFFDPPLKESSARSRLGAGCPQANSIAKNTISKAAAPPNCRRFRICLCLEPAAPGEAQPMRAELEAHEVSTRGPKTSTDPDA